MTRSFVPLLGLAASLCGLIGRAHADVCTPQENSFFVDCTVTGTIVNGQAEFSLPQINPPLGQAVPGLTFIQLQTTLSGSVMVSFTCPPFQNGMEPHCDFGASFTPVLSNSPGSPVSFTIDGSQRLVFGSCSGNPNGQTCTTTFPWSDGISTQFLQDYNPSSPGYDPNLLQALTGTGEVTFGITESLSNLMGSNGGSSITGTSFDPSPYTVELQYRVIPAVVPEPSLFAITAALLGLIVFLRRRRRGLAT